MPTLFLDLIYFLGKTLPLLLRVNQLRKSVGQLNPCYIQFKPLCYLWHLRVQSGQRSKRCRIVTQKNRVLTTEIGLYLRHQDLVKGAVRYCRVRIAVRVAKKGILHRQSLPGWSQINSKPLPAKQRVIFAKKRLGYCCMERREQRLTLIHQVPVIPTGMIPFQHGKFGMMLAPSLLLTEAMTYLKKLGTASGKKSLHALFGRCLQKPAFTCEGNQI